MSTSNPASARRSHRRRATLALGALATAAVAVLPFVSGPDPVLASGAAATAAKFRLENVVPNDALFYASIDDVPAFVESLKGTATYRTWLDPEVQAFFGDAVRHVQSKIEEGRSRMESEIGVDLRALRTMIDGQAAIAVLAPAGERSHMPRFVASVDLGANAPRFREIARALLAKAREKAGDAIAHDSYTYEGISVDTIRFGDDDGTIHSSLIGSALVLSSDENAMNDTIEAATSGARSRVALAALPRFRSVMARVRGGQGESAAAYVDVAAAIAAFAPEMRGRDRAVFDALGIADVRAIGMATTIASDGVRDTVFVDAPEERRGILKLLDLPQRPLRTIDLAPEGTLLYVGFHLEPREIVSEIRRIATAADASAAERMDRGLAEAREKLGFDPIEDLVGALGDEFSFFLRAPRSGMIPDMALVGALADGAKLESTLARIEALVREHVGSDAVSHAVSRLPGGGKLHSISPSGSPIGLHVGIDGDTIVVGGHLETVREALSGRSSGLRRDAQFVSGLKTLDIRPDSGVGSLVYVNLRDGLSYLYNVATPFVANWKPRSGGVPFDMALLPSAEALTRHMSPIVQVLESEPGGLVARSVTPTGNTLVIYATIGAILLGY